MNAVVVFQSVRVRLLRSMKAIPGPIVVAIAYYLGAQAAFYVGTLSDRIFAPFWPPNIVLFCTLLLVPRRSWWLYIAATFPAHVIAEVAVGMPSAQLLVAFATNCTVAILNAIGVRRFLGGPPWFGTLRHASIYILITAVVSPGLSALGGAFVQILGGGSIAQYWTFWTYWYIANALGSVTLGPVFLIWFSQRSEVAGQTPRRKTETAILVLSLVLVCAIAFRASTGEVAAGFLPALLYSPLPFILWAAIRFGEKGASGAILIVTVVSISQNLHVSTEFVDLDPEKNVLALQLFLMGIAVPVFLLGATIDELRRASEKTRHLAGSLLQAQDEERRRIARELHDSTGQNLVVATWMAARIRNMAAPSSVPVVNELNDILQRSIQEIRTFAYLLHPPLLDEGGLDFALRSYIDGFSARSGLDVDLDLSPELDRLPPDVELVLFRVIQEALTNVWRHSGSTTARIQLMRRAANSGQEVMLMIEDAGKGIPNNDQQSPLSGRKIQPQDPSGLGLVGMRERLHQIGGRLQIDSMIGKTVIKAIVPLN